MSSCLDIKSRSILLLFHRRELIREAQNTSRHRIQATELHASGVRTESGRKTAPFHSLKEQFMTLTITVLTVTDRPSFSVPPDSSPAVIRKMVANRFGWVAVGVQHSWIGRLAH